MTNIPDFVPNGWEIVTIRKDFNFNGEAFLSFGSFSNIVVLGGALTISEPVVVSGGNMLLFGSSPQPNLLSNTTNLLPQRAFKTLAPTLIGTETYFVSAGLNGGFASLPIFGKGIVAELTLMRAR